MFEARLFLGFPVDPLFSLQLDQSNQNLIKQFIRNEGDYLTEVYREDLRFLGKAVGKIAAVSELELVEANIYSLLKRLVPDFPYDETPLYLFPIVKSESATQTR